MEREFEGIGGKSAFLKKRKQQKEQLERRLRQQKAANKIQGFFLRVREQQKFLIPFIKENLEKLDMILLKRSESEPQKYYKMIGNALYKMPFILQSVIFINDRNLPTFQPYIFKLCLVLSGNNQTNPIIRKVLSNRGFPLVQLHKVLRFAVRMFGQQLVYEQLFVEFVAEAVGMGQEEEVAKMLKNQGTRKRLEQAIRDCDWRKEHREVVLKNIVLPYPEIQKALSAQALANFFLSTPIAHPKLYQTLDQILTYSNVFEMDFGFLDKCNDLPDKLKVVERWLQFDMERCRNNAWPLVVPLYLNNKILKAYYTVTVQAIKEQLVGKKLLEQMDPEDIQDLMYRVYNTVDYEIVIKRLKLNFYFGKLVHLFKQELQTSNIEIMQSHKNPQQETVLQCFCELYILLSEIFNGKHIHLFGQLANKHFLLSLYLFLSNIKFSYDFNTQNPTCQFFFIDLFVKYLLAFFTSMDDVEFVDQNKSFPKDKLAGLVGFLNNLVYQLIISSTGKKVVTQTPQHKQLKQSTILLLNDLYHKTFRTKLLPCKIFEMPKLNHQLDQIQFGTDTHIQTFLKALPFAFQFQRRLHKFRSCIAQDMLHFDRDEPQDFEEDNAMTITVRRGHEFNDAFHRCFGMEMRNRYIITFINEQGLEEIGFDGGGIIKEFLNRVIKTAFDPLYGLFRETPLKEIIPNPECVITSNNSMEYEFIGMLVGKAIYQNILIQPKFAGPFLNQMIGRVNGLEDLKSIDPELYRNLIMFKHTKQDISTLHFTFSFTQNGKTIQLKQNGSNIPVTNQNKLEFVMAFADYKVNRQFQQHSRLFRKGFTRVISKSWLQMFNHDELNLMISGKQANFDVKDLMKNTEYDHYTPEDKTIKYFWEIVTSMTAEEKSQLLLFVTSCSRPPTLGFSQLKPSFHISKSFQKDFLPTAHTCINMLKLPDYRDKQVLRKKLFYAIQAKAGFQFG